MTTNPLRVISPHNFEHLLYVNKVGIFLYLGISGTLDGGNDDDGDDDVHTNVTVDAVVDYNI